MDRRTLIRTGSMGLTGLIGLGLEACSRGTGPSALSPSLRLAPVQVSWDRVIRTTVGLRPYRPSGFVLRGERLDGKTLIHNYGHGGSGMSLSWGTGSMAADLAQGRDERRATSGSDRVWRSWPYDRAAAPAARFRGDHLCDDRPSRHDVEHVARCLDPHQRPRRLQSPDSAVGRTTPAGRTNRLPRASAPDRSRVRAFLDRLIRTTGDCAYGASRGRQGGSTAATGVADRIDATRSGRAPLSDAVRESRDDTANRSLHILGCPRP